jgi:hypothetical protein
VIVAAVASTGCKKKASNPFPPSGAIAGWEKTSETRTFAASKLSDYIDGDAEQYLSAGVCYHLDLRLQISRPIGGDPSMCTR